ncbi:MAG: 6-phospho-3-hexuloisomerase [Nitrososphaerales archaeon]
MPQAECVFLAAEVGGEVKSSMIGLLTLITQTVSQISEEEIGLFVEKIMKHRDSKILVMGAGRSGMVGRAFALRLLHLGYQVHILGDTLVPSIGEKDLVIAISGSGATKLVVAAAEAAKAVGAEIVAVTSFPDSPIGKLADLKVTVKGRVMDHKQSREDYFARQILGLHEPLAPLGTLFEDSCMVLFDAVVSVLLEKHRLSEEEMRNRHANIE